MYIPKNQGPSKMKVLRVQTPAMQGLNPILHYIIFYVLYYITWLLCGTYLDQQIVSNIRITWYNKNHINSEISFGASALVQKRVTFTRATSKDIQEFGRLLQLLNPSSLTAHPTRDFSPDGSAGGSGRGVEIPHLSWTSQGKPCASSHAYSTKSGQPAATCPFWGRTL